MDGACYKQIVRTHPPFPLLPRIARTICLLVEALVLLARPCLGCQGNLTRLRLSASVLSEKQVVRGEVEPGHSQRHLLCGRSPAFFLIGRTPTGRKLFFLSLRASVATLTLPVCLPAALHTRPCPNPELVCSGPFQPPRAPPSPGRLRPAPHPLRPQASVPRALIGARRSLAF